MDKVIDLLDRIERRAKQAGDHAAALAAKDDPITMSIPPHQDDITDLDDLITMTCLHA